MTNKIFANEGGMSLLVGVAFNCDLIPRRVIQASPLIASFYVRGVLEQGGLCAGKN